MWELKITTQGAKHDITRTERFDTVEGAADRRTFLKSIEQFGSSNIYSLTQAGR